MNIRGIFLGIIAKKCLKYTSDKRKNLKHRRSLFKSSRKYKAKPTSNGPDEDYGLAQPLTDFLSDEEIQKKKMEFIKLLSISETERKKIEFDTRSQANNNKWFIERRNRLTASNFGKVCKMRPSTSCKALVHNILYGNPQTNAMEYGKLSEELALKKLEEQIQKPIQKCGLFIDERKPYLAATPGKNIYLINLRTW